MQAISIIIPIYGVEKYLRQCLDSVLNQTFTDWQAICVDDGSPDNSGKIAEEYAKRDNRFVVIHKQNGGPSDARDVGMKHATGEYVMFLDGDDFLTCMKCKSIYNIKTGEIRKEQKEEKVRKCPACGEILKIYDSICPACGYEMKDNT